MVIDYKKLEDDKYYIENYFKVITKADEGGQSDLVPMILWPSQLHYVQNSTHRDIILKGRQMGISTGVEARNTKKIFTNRYQNMAIVTHDMETSEFLLRNVDRFWNGLPNEIKAEKGWDSAHRKTFGAPIDAYIYIDSAKSDNIGIGHTLNIFHGSEIAKWPHHKANLLFAGISQTVPLGGFITLESTPQGRIGLFHELYQGAKKGENGFKPFFYAWWWDPNYKLEGITELKDDFDSEICAAIIGISTAKFLTQEKQMMEEYNLVSEQMAWRRMKLKELRELFFQEYPENDIDCWLSNEMAVVSGVYLKPYFTQIKDGREEGPLTIWKDFVGGKTYVIGVDTASGSARDYSVASVIDVKNMEYVARLRGKIHTDLFAEYLDQLGKRYGNALIAVERIGHGHSVLRVLLEKNYPNIYYHLDYDEMVADNVVDAGWKTSVKTKPLLVNGMITAFRTQDLISYSENLLLEASGLMWEGGVDSRVKKSAGGNDDEFDAVAIAIQVREQTPVIADIARPSVKTYRQVFV